MSLKRPVLLYQNNQFLTTVKETSQKASNIDGLIGCNLRALNLFSNAFNLQIFDSVLQVDRI